MNGKSMKYILAGQTKVVSAINNKMKPKIQQVPCAEYDLLYTLKQQYTLIQLKTIDELEQH